MTNDEAIDILGTYLESAERERNLAGPGTRTYWMNQIDALDAAIDALKQPCPYEAKKELEKLVNGASFGIGHKFGMRSEDIVRCENTIRRALERQRVPKGWKLVPFAPTQAMLTAADAGDREYTDRAFGEGFPLQQQSGYDHYVAMLDAAPEPGENDDGRHRTEP